MRLTRVFAEGFRCFGPANALDVVLSAGITTLVGENDSGKTAIIDAIRLALGTRGEEYLRLQESDFHLSKGGRMGSLKICCTFEQLSVDEQARFLEWCTLDPAGPIRLLVTLTARRADRVWYERRAGLAGDGPTVDGELREYLHATYLRPLRDAERELRPGRRSRLSQILASLPDLDGQEKVEHPLEFEPKRLAEVLTWADSRIKSNVAIKAIELRVNEEYLAHLALGDDDLSASLSLGRGSTLAQLLERLELILSDANGASEKVARGLGMNNVLFMAAELLLLQSQGDAFRLLLVEEPEAHLHPQLQVRFMEMLRNRLKSNPGVQILLTSHSPILAAGAPVESLVLTTAGATYSLAKGATKLRVDDYDFLYRFLDATKANLFFAKGVLIVEGDAENLLLPALARRLGRSLERHGVSIVKVGHTGLFRYSRIFQRADDRLIPIPVACIGDRDIPPDDARALDRPPKKTQSDWTPEALLAKERRLREPEGGSVKVFLSPQWTLEFDLAAHGFAVEMHQAVLLASISDDRDSLMKRARDEVAQWRNDGSTDTAIALRIFDPLYRKVVSKTETAEHLAVIISDEAPGDAASFRGRLPAYLVNAIEHVTSSPGRRGENADARP